LADVRPFLQSAGRRNRERFVEEYVLVGDDTAGPLETTITRIEADGSLVLAVHAFAPAHG